MSVDPQVQALLDFLVQSGRPAINTLTPEEAREVARKSTILFAPPAPDMAEVKDLFIEGPGGPLPLRYYRPLGSQPTDKLPVLMFFHGGGFVIGDLDTHDTSCRILANRAHCAVVAVDYRMGPEHRFPAAVEDSWAATLWVRDNAASLVLDPTRMATGGDSAGGNLAAVVALMARDAGIKLAFQLLIYPVTDMAGQTESYEKFAEGYMLTRDAMTWFRDLYIKTEPEWTDWRVSPLRAEKHTGVAPALVITAGFDPLRDEGKAYAERLEAAGVPVRYVNYDGLVHGFMGWGKLVAASHHMLDLAGGALAEAFAR